MAEKYAYAFIRKDLPDSQKLVQISHAAIEMGRFLMTSGDPHPSVVVIGANSELQLRNILSSLREKGIKATEFFEPLFNNEMTSFVTEPIGDDQRHHLGKFNLIKDSAFCRNQGKERS